MHVIRVQPGFCARLAPVQRVQHGGGEGGGHDAEHGGRGVRELERDAVEHAPRMDVCPARREEEARERPLHRRPLLDLRLHLRGTAAEGNLCKALGRERLLELVLWSSRKSSRSGNRAPDA